MITLYGINNCDTIKRARCWLDNHNIDYHFHDFRVDGLDPLLLESWVRELGWETLVNRRSTTWRALTENEKSSMDEQSAVQTMLAQPTLIKRPVLVTQENVMVGFSEKNYSENL